MDRERLRYKHTNTQRYRIHTDILKQFTNIRKIHIYALTYISKHPRPCWKHRPPKPAFFTPTHKHGLCSHRYAQRYLHTGAVEADTPTFFLPQKNPQHSECNVGAHNHVCTQRNRPVCSCTQTASSQKCIHKTRSQAVSHGLRNVHALTWARRHARVVFQPAHLPLASGPRAPATHTKAKVTTCFTCSELYHCSPLPFPEERTHCLQTAGITASGEGNSVAWRNGSCMASEDCPSDNSISALTYSIGFGFWVNTTCCQGNCQAPTPLATLPASSTLSKFLCPACPEGLSGPCNHSFYMQCPSEETECVQLDLVSEEGEFPRGSAG
ncbi:uncharacterized protein LOC106507601 isoform X2 [Sus scrofa]|uniref:uncharacterized protein LOC106507601 isoform X2 n=1 Tax=Sus scrofa TaxID=9823 RepID=UPI000A2B97FA|nr:uncharacterized protein LOC106507601 isoform X2 [Sus scrofa]